LLAPKLTATEKRALADKHKTSHSGFVYCRYFPIKEKVGGKRGLKFRLSKVCIVPITLQAQTVQP